MIYLSLVIKINAKTYNKYVLAFSFEFLKVE